MPGLTLNTIPTRSTMASISFVVDRRENGQTLAAVLKARYGLSWSQAKRLIERRHVKIGGQVETDVARRLKPGKRVELAAGTVEVAKSEPAQSQPSPKPRSAQPSKSRPSPPASRPRAASSPSQHTEALPRRPAGASAVEIVYADDAVVVADKPAGLTTMRHPDEAAEFGEHARKFLPATLADRLPELLGAPGRPVIAVHRIDRDTSGLVVFARTRAAAEHLARQFRKHTVDRRYRALTRGMPLNGRIESIIVRDRGDGRRGSISLSPSSSGGGVRGEGVSGIPPSKGKGQKEGKRAVTHVKVIESWGEFALVECRLETGRTHQVRIHLGEAGTPLCGERVYDRPSHGQPAPDGSSARRPMLHAARLGFVHPETGVEMMWEVPAPEDFLAVQREVSGRK